MSTSDWMMWLCVSLVVLLVCFLGVNIYHDQKKNGIDYMFQVTHEQKTWMVCRKNLQVGSGYVDFHDDQGMKVFLIGTTSVVQTGFRCDEGK